MVSTHDAHSTPSPALSVRLTDGLAVVTGAAGFIGSHLVEALAARGVRVRALVHYNALGAIGNLRYLTPAARDHVEIVFGDVQDGFAMRALLRGGHVVFHLAALIGIPYSYVAPASYVGTNISGTLNILEAARSEGVARVLVTSTSETYGTAQYTPIDEMHPLVAQSPYAATKIAADQLALSYNRSFGLPVTVVRPFNTFGPRQSARAVIPTIVTQALGASGEIHLGSTAPRRDLTYVTDTAQGFLALAERAEAVGRVTNLGTGVSRTVGDMAHAVAKILGRKLKIVEDSTRVRPERSEVTELCADASLARQLGWAPLVSFEEGLELVVAFIRENRGDFAQAGEGYRI